MKFGTTIVALAAVAAQAAAVLEQQEAHPVFKGGVGHCGAPGGKCQEGKNLARAVAEAIKETDVDDTKAHGMSAFCAVEGSSGCNEKWQHVAKIGAAAEKAHSAISAREAYADADAVAAPKNRWINYCGVPGSFCAAKRDALAEAGADPKNRWINYCGVPGSFCAKRDVEGRSADAEPKNRWINYCGVPGSFCAAKREAEAAPDAYRWINYCGVPGSFCASKRSADAEAAPKNRWINYCGVPGSFCAEKRSEVDEYQKAIRKFNPNIEKAECFQNGQPCDLITKAHTAFKTVQAREAEAKNRWINYCGVPGSFCAKRDVDKLAQCSHEGCSVPAKAHLQASAAGAPDARKAEEECHGPNGACTLAARAVDELEQAINEGLTEVYAL
ncbi:hypothetical protein LTS16_017895 [Friedmanniomyces endolithicus]|nr:hypothetical protein LTR94_006969 [Friedmanniomyces endolithicus]KAK0788065.1 hypothetical protein LTR59_010137 [Friedmanniomyces endolithicus]KAK0798298.1 hypothetical protein LTR75_009597 [Friedmanniomyces endolithicus]KAK0808803.1 hypothetical protein LTR38_004509 [Friedmanniomyces endolithicus]KAK0870589.1 hypothetical protein LTS02_002384 [Friedmanniomyces endolithicus]